jgi:hypothetical protein
MRTGRRLSARATIALAGVLAAAVLLPTFKTSSAAADPPGCFAGARSLSTFGARVYPEMGNGGYTSLHTDLHTITTRSRTCSCRARAPTSR